MALDLFEALNGSLRRLHHIQRFSSIPVIKSENVAEHSWHAAMIGLLVSYDLNSKDPHTVDAGEVVKRCITHDISEAMSGDIIRTYKYGSPEMRKACENADFENTSHLTDEFGGPNDKGLDKMFALWVRAKDKTLEGDVVRLADVMCVVVYCAEEYHMGNRRIDFVLQRTYDQIVVPMLNHATLGVYVRQMFPTPNYADAYRKTEKSWIKTW